jgi:hypothetical protein
VLPSQTAQAPQPGGYAPNYYGAATGADAYAQTPPGAGYQQAPYGQQPGYGYQNSGTGLYDAQPGTVAQTGGYPVAQPGSYPQPTANVGYTDPSAVNNDYYNSAYARQDATGQMPPQAPASGPAPGGYAQSPGYAPIEAAPQGAGIYDSQSAAGMPVANATTPHAVYPEQVADSRYGSPAAMPAAAAIPAASQPAANTGYGAAAGSRYSQGAPADPMAASTSAGNYNEPSGFQPGASGYAPGANGFQPPGTSPYQPPAGPYNANPNNPAAGGYRPGSTGSYHSPTGAVTPSNDMRTSSTGSAVAPANYTVGANSTDAEIPAIYKEAMGEIPSNVQ